MNPTGMIYYKLSHQVQICVIDVIFHLIFSMIDEPQWYEATCFASETSQKLCLMCMFQILNIYMLNTIWFVSAEMSKMWKYHISCIIYDYILDMKSRLYIPINRASCNTIMNNDHVEVICVLWMANIASIFHWSISSFQQNNHRLHCTI